MHSKKLPAEVSISAERGFCPEGVGDLQEVTMAATGCEAALKPVTSVATDVPYLLVLLPVPDRSRTCGLVHED
ncbi:hypothetical protein PSA5_27380 [Pseudomonas syringae pv. actinidiae]|nr:hypothetical protein PSA5_27380 [Pseudomonas syringae pv. actinidiae]